MVCVDLKSGIVRQMTLEGRHYRIHYAAVDRGPGIKENIAYRVCYVRLRYMRGLSHDDAVSGCKHHLAP
jgi:hypothetical protein